ncbi:MAG TPA: hypothetical protein VGI30_09565 [Caulobacteraceae bacterium]
MSDESDAPATVSGAGASVPAHALLDTILKISLAACAVLAALTVAGYFLVYVPLRDHQAALQREHQAQLAAQAERENLARQAQERADKAASVKAALDSCLEGANTDYTANWSHDCQARGMAAGCALPAYETQAIVTTRENAKARCVEVARYGVPPPPAPVS